jgi:hypothetical protein
LAFLSKWVFFVPKLRTGEEPTSTHQSHFYEKEVKLGNTCHIIWKELFSFPRNNNPNPHSREKPITSLRG